MSDQPEDVPAQGTGSGIPFHLSYLTSSTLGCLSLLPQQPDRLSIYTEECRFSVSPLTEKMEAVRKLPSLSLKFPPSSFLFSFPHSEEESPLLPKSLISTLESVPFQNSEILLYQFITSFLYFLSSCY